MHARLTALMVILVVAIVMQPAVAIAAPSVDLSIYYAKDDTTTGSGVINEDGTGQTKEFRIRHGKTLTFEVTCTNAGTADDGIALTATKLRGYKIAYRFYSGMVDISSDVYGAGHSLGSLAPVNGWMVYVDVTPKANAPAKGSWLVTGTSATDGSVIDVVRFKAVHRG